MRPRPPEGLGRVLWLQPGPLLGTSPRAMSALQTLCTLTPEAEGLHSLGCSFGIPQKHLKCHSENGHYAGQGERILLPSTAPEKSGAVWVEGGPRERRDAHTGVMANRMKNERLHFPCCGKGSPLLFRKCVSLENF